MVLQFKFKYLSSDKTLAKFLHNTVKDFDCDFKILQDLDYVYLFLEANEQTVEAFSNALSTNLPMSLYYYELSVDVVKRMPSNETMDLTQDKLISFSPATLKEVEDINSKDYYNAFKSYKVSDGFVKDAVFVFDGVEEKSSKALFEKIAKLIDEDKKIKIKTLSGEFVFSKLKNLDESDELLATNLMKLSSLVVENKTDVVALASIEKPKVEFKVNEIYKVKNNISKTHVDIRYANDLILFLLSKELQDYNIDFLDVQNNDTQFDYFLDVKEENQREDFLDIPKVKCFEDKKIFIESNSYPKNLDLIYNKFEEKNKSQFMTVLAENNIFDKSIVNFYMSTKHDDGLSFYSDKFDGFVDIVKPFYFPRSIEELFEQLQKDEVGKRLVQNYKEKFSDIYEEAINSDISNINIKSFYSYWKIAKIVLGFKNDILTNAGECLLEKGPRVDYKLSLHEKMYEREFDFVRLIKSAMSFKLAGVEEETISLGYIESLAHFIASEVDDIHSAHEVDGVSLCGDMFTYDIFTKLVEKSITKNFKLYYNREFVIQK